MYPSDNAIRENKRTTNDYCLLFWEWIAMNLINWFSACVNFNSFDILIVEYLIITWVTVSDEEDVIVNDTNICNEIYIGGERGEDVSCNYRGRNPPPRGRYVTIRQKYGVRGYHYIVTFCEVEVLSCHRGFWGKDLDNYTDCSRPCGRCIETICRVSDGHCYTGCQEGFWGDRCDEQCYCEDCDRLTGCPAGESQFHEPHDGTCYTSWGYLVRWAKGIITL